jgi:hypothetical protein
MEGDGISPPKKLFGYAPKYALSIWGPASKKFLNKFFFNSGIQEFPEKFHL